MLLSIFKRTAALTGGKAAMGGWRSAHGTKKKTPANNEGPQSISIQPWAPRIRGRQNPRKEGVYGGLLQEHWWFKLES